MNLLSVFAAFFLLAFVVLVIVASYAKHMGDPEPTDWKVVFLLAAAAGAVGAGGVGAVQEIVRLVQIAWGMLS